jgi:hypothetical protein
MSASFARGFCNEYNFCDRYVSNVAGVLDGYLFKCGTCDQTVDADAKISSSICFLT